MIDFKQRIILRDEGDGEHFTAYFPASGTTLHLTPVEAFWINGIFKEHQTVEVIAHHIAEESLMPLNEVSDDGQEFLYQLELVLSGQKILKDEGVFLLPTHAELVVGTACNLRCVNCLLPNFSQLMSREMLLDVIKELGTLGIFVVKFIGGEIFIHPAILEALRLADSFGMRIEFSSNGTKIDNKVADQLAALPFLVATISIDGTETTNDVIRGKNVYQAALSATQRLTERRVPTAIAMTLRKSNYDCWREIVALGQELGAVVGIMPMNPYHTGDMTDVISSEQYFDMFVELHRMKLKGMLVDTRNVTLQSLCNGDRVLENECEAAIRALSILADGTVVSCSVHHYAGGNNGTALPTYKDIRRVWANHAGFESFRRTADFQGCEVRNILFRGSDPFGVTAFRQYLTERKIQTPIK